jgi:sulfur-oxidizing protein SoxX
MKNCLWVIAIVAALVFFLSGCEVGPKSGRGFTLPEGDVAAGEKIFTSLSCNACHVVIGNERIKQPDNPQLSIRLGGNVARVQSYGELVTSVINPSHRLPRTYAKELVSDNGVSKMANYNEVMTVEQLIHLVAFLQSHYEMINYQRTVYPLYSASP